MLGRLRDGVIDLSEIHRFANTPISEQNSIRWDVDRLWSEICRGLELASTVESVAIDTWGVDYALLDTSGDLLQKPFHYRDARTNGAMEAVFSRVGRDRIYDVTGIQFLSFNTIYQLHAERGDVLARARTMLMMPDYFTYRLTGRAVSGTPTPPRRSAWTPGHGRGQSNSRTMSESRLRCSRRWSKPEA